MFVTSEPDLGEDFCVVVSIRHLKKGLIRRMFVSERKIKEVYDWIGPLAMYPMYFDLFDYQKGFYRYADTIGSCWYILNMSKRDAPNEVVIQMTTQLCHAMHLMWVILKQTLFQTLNSQTS